MSNLRIEVIEKPNLKETVKLVSENGFQKNSFDPAESAMISAIEFQKKTNNYGYPFALGLFDEEKLVGIYIMLVMRFVRNNKNYDCIQSSSLYISPGYRGVFRQFIYKINELFPDVFKLFMFSAIPVLKTARKFHYPKIATNQFQYNRYFLLRPIQFLSSSISKPFLAQSIQFFRFLNPLFKSRIKFNNNQNVFASDEFSHNYQLLENAYYAKYPDKFVVEWNAQVLHNKYGKSTVLPPAKLQENAGIQLLCANNKEEISGVLIAKKIADTKRLIIIELKYISDGNIATSLINRLIEIANNYKIETIVVNDAEWVNLPNNIKKKFRIKKATGLGTHMDLSYKNKSYNADDFVLHYADDDMFY